MKTVDLGQTKSHIFDNYLIIALSKTYLKLNHDLPIIFDGKLEGSKLTLSTNLPIFDNAKEVDDNAM
ncbi:MAG: hypothetical protein K8Q88_00015 [Nitrosarchaeum sp.]|nr:hypothetical protein [Nitrosarchaeum sp.]